MPGRVTAYQFYITARAVQFVRQQAQQCLICRRVHRRRSDFNPQFISERLTYFVGRCARLKFDRQGHAVGLNS
jgi:hypothetical protein